MLNYRKAYRKIHLCRYSSGKRILTNLYENNKSALVKLNLLWLLWPK